MYRVYQVQSGETIEQIAQKLNTTVDNLKNINGIQGNLALRPGSFIIVPMVNNRFTTYVVKKGDNPYSIAKEANIDYDLLLKINGLNNDDYIYPGQELILPSKDYKFYLTKDGDTIKSVMEDLNIDYNNLISNNERIMLKEEQLILYK